MRYRLVLVWVTAFATVSSLSCGRAGDRGGGRGGGAENTTAWPRLSVKGGTVTAPNTCTQFQIVWKLTPGQLTGTEGRDTELTIEKTYKARQEPETGAVFRCYYDERDGASGLRVGTWMIGMTLGGGTKQCTETLSSGISNVNFSSAHDGCTRGNTYPGP
jgi:hypothetical protein